MIDDIKQILRMVETAQEYSAATKRTVRRNLERALGAVLVDVTYPVTNPLAVTDEEFAVTVEEFVVANQPYPGGIIPAIKLYRKRTGQGLRESKEAIEAAIARWSRLGVVDPVSVDPLAVTNAEKQIANQTGGMITAIKAYRERTGQGVKESKEAIEAAIGRKVGDPR